MGPAFDSVGLALAIYCQLTFILLDNPDPRIPLVTFRGAVASRSRPEDITNLIYKVLSKLWSDDHELLQRIRLIIDSDIPLGVGLGGSPAAILGALWAAAFFKDYIPTTSTLLSEAGALEGHHESVAASLMGEFVVCAKETRGNGIIARQHKWPEVWRTIMIVPRYNLKTAQLRSILPKKVSFDDAVENVQRAALLVSAVARCDDAALKEALHDKLHESYREQQYVPLLGKVKQLLSEDPVLGVVLSGGGPSILVLVHVKHHDEIMDKLQAWAPTEPEHITILDLDVDRRGVQELTVNQAH